MSAMFPVPIRRSAHTSLLQSATPTGTAVAQPDPLHLDRINPSLHQALRTMAVPHDALAPVRQSHAHRRAISLRRKP